MPPVRGMNDAELELGVPRKKKGGKNAARTEKMMIKKKSGDFGRK